MSGKLERGFGFFAPCGPVFWGVEIEAGAVDGQRMDKPVINEAGRAVVASLVFKLGHHPIGEDRRMARCAILRCGAHHRSAA